MSKAVVVRHSGGPEALEVVDGPVPAPGPGEVRVRVAATAVHPIDLRLRAGAFDAVLGDTARPYRPGWDLAGIVDAVGPDVTDLAPGQPVIGFAPWFATQTGTYAEHVVLPADALAPAPRTLTPTEAAALPLNAVTAVQALDLSGLTAGQTVLITGAAGALGGFLTEIAAARGLRVVAVASRSDEEWLRAHGAADVVPRSDDFAAAVRALLPDGADGAIDPAALGRDALALVRDGGVLIPTTDQVPEPERGIRVEVVRVVGNHEQLAWVAVAADRGELTARVAEVFPLERAADAHARLEKGGVRGRLILTA